MRVFKTNRKVSKEVPMSFFNFERFEKLCGDFAFIDARIDFRALKAELKGQKVVYFEIEEPNRFASPDPAFRREEYEWDFYKILCVCPYTTEWLNRLQGKERRQFVFFPFDKSLVPAPTEKRYDVIYFGSILSREILETIKTIAKFDYRFIAPSEEMHNSLLNGFKIVRSIKRKLGIKARERYLTNKDVTHREKLKLISESKVTIVHNILFHNVFAARCVQNTPDFRSNGAFAEIPDKSMLRSLWHAILGKEYIVPQQKTRLFEAAFCRSLILCRKDRFNVIERFFEPGKEFVYYEEGRLEETLERVLADYDSYKQTIENAYQRAMRDYTTDAFFEKYLKNLS
jgi:hypothetical protein